MASGGFSYGAPSGAAAEVAVVRAIYDAFARRDAEAARPYLHDDFEALPTGTARMTGRTAPYRGPEGLQEYLEDVGRAWRSLHLEADDIRAVAGSVVVFGAIRAETHDGRVLTRRVLWTWRLRDGKAVSVGVNDFGG